MAYTICFLTAIGTLLFFLVYGLMHVSSVESYFNCNNQLEGKEFGNSFAAASTSLATVLFFFVTLGLTNGLWILISPISFLIGTEFFNRCMLPRLKQQNYSILNEGGTTLGNTLGDYIKTRYNSESVKKWIIFITLFGIISIMLIELYVGVQIFKIFINEEYEEFALYFIALVSFIYTGLGGLNAVVQTDKWQFFFMMTVAFLIIVFLLFYYGNPVSWEKVFPPLWGSEGVLLNNWALFLNIITVNALLVPSLLRNWQLIAATKNELEIKKGFRNGVFMTALISFLFICFGILFFTIFKEAPLSMNGILTTMAESSSPFMSYVLFPLLFAACLMALLSTFDSSLLPVVQCLANDIFPKPKKRKKMYTIYMLATLFVTVFIYKIVFKKLEFDIISWLFTIFSVVTISSPAILFACFGKESILHTKTMHFFTKLSTLLGLVIALTISVYGNNFLPKTKGSLSIIQLNAPIAIIISSLLLCIVYFIIRYYQSKK